MGEITDALKRARATVRARQALEEADRSPEIAPAQPLREAEPEVARGLDQRSPSVELPLERDDEWPARIVAIEQRGPAAEAFRHLAIKVRQALERRKAHGVVVTGPLQNEGKTTIACNLALAMASLSSGRHVALVDLDLRLASVAPDLQLPRGAGIEEVLAGRKSLADVRISVDVPPLDVYPCFESSDAPHELLSDERLRTLVRELDRRYAVVVYDTPPALVVSDTRLILSQVPSWIAVARSGSTRFRAFERMMELLPKEGFLGATLNEGPLAAGVSHYDRYYYGSSKEPSET